MLGMAATAVGKSRRPTLHAWRCKASPALNGPHLEPAAAISALDVGLETRPATTTVFDAERPTASAATASLRVSTTSGRGRSGPIAAVAAAMIAWLGARRHRYRQSGDTSGKKQPGHCNSPSNLRFKRTVPQHVPPFGHRLANRAPILARRHEPRISLLFR
jgi:hypothetical protein